VSDSTAVILLTTIGVTADVEVIARTLVEERLAACVNVLPPMQSFYRWEGAVQRDDERQLVIKTSPARLPALEARLRALHPYELPETLVLTASGSREYLAWIGESTA
jgi:periplasmic divalent cation tolerance protein